MAGRTPTAGKSVVGRILAAALLGTSVLAHPAPTAGQQSAAISVRIEVAPVHRVGFDTIPPGLRDAELLSRAQAGGNDANDAGGGLRPEGMEARARPDAAGEPRDRQRIGVAPSGFDASDSVNHATAVGQGPRHVAARAAGLASPTLCAPPAVRPGAPRPWVSVSERVTRAENGSSEPVRVVTCTLVAP